MTIDDSQVPPIATLETTDGYYLGAVNGGGMPGTPDNPMRTNAKKQDTWEEFAFSGHELPAINAVENWSIEIPGWAQADRYVQGAHVDGRIWVSIKDKRELYCLDAISGKITFKTSLPFKIEKIANYGSRLAILSTNGLYDFDTMTLSLNKKYEWTYNNASTQLASSGNYCSALILGTESSVVQLSTDGTVKRIYQSESGDAWKPLKIAYISNLLALLGIQDANPLTQMVCYDADSGEMKENLSYGMMLPGSLTSDGMRLAISVANEKKDSGMVFLYEQAEGGLRRLGAIDLPLSCDTNLFAATISGTDIYIPTGNEITVFNVPQNKKEISFSSVGKTTRALNESPSGLVYAATDLGVAELDARGGFKSVRFENISQKNNIIGSYGGVVYAALDNKVVSLRLDELARQFYVESTLLQDYSEAEPGSQLPIDTTPTYQMTICLTTKDGEPRPNEILRLTSTAQVQITSGGGGKIISPEKSAEFITDGQGRVRLTVKPGNYDSTGVFHPGIVCPDLIAIAPFMNSMVGIVINLSGSAIRRVAGITSTELKKAVGYDKKPALNQKYLNDQKALDALAKALNQTAGMIAQSADDHELASRADATQPMSCCSEFCDPLCACMMPVTNLNRPTICHKAFSFSFDPGNSYFKLIDDGEAGELSERSVALGFPSWDNIWDDLKKGVGKVISGTVTAINAAKKIAQITVTGIIDGVTKFITVALDSLEKASLVIQGIFLEAMSSIEKAVEFLSKVFDWSAILKKKNDISKLVNLGLTELLQGSSIYSLPKIKDRLHSETTHMKESIREALQGLKSAYGTQTGAAMVADLPGGKAGLQGVGSTEQNWLNDKIIHSSFRTPNSVLESIEEGSGWSFPKLDLGKDALDLIEAFIVKLEGAGYDAAKDALNGVKGGFSENIKSGYLGKALGALIDILDIVAEMVLEIAYDVFEFILDFGRLLIEKIQDLLKRDISDIPFVGTFYKWISKEKTFTLLDLVALAIAFPAHIADVATEMDNADQNTYKALTQQNEGGPGTITLRSLGVLIACSEGLSATISSIYEIGDALGGRFSKEVLTSGLLFLTAINSVKVALGVRLGVQINNANPGYQAWAVISNILQGLASCVDRTLSNVESRGKNGKSESYEVFGASLSTFCGVVLIIADYAIFYTSDDKSPAASVAFADAICGDITLATRVICYALLESKTSTVPMKVAAVGVPILIDTAQVVLKGVYAGLLPNSSNVAPLLAYE
jgi:hypothetical protein